MIFRTKDGKYIGSLVAGTFRKQVYRSTHMLREPEAWAIDREVVRKLELIKGKLTPPCKNIVVYDKENNFTYQVEFAVFLDKAFEIDRGYGKQLALPLTYWKFKLARKGERLKKFTSEAYYLAHTQQQGKDK